MNGCLSRVQFGCFLGVAPMGRTFRKHSTDVLREKRTTIFGQVENSTFLLPPYPRCTIGRRGAVRDSVSRQDVNVEGAVMDSAYAAWVGLPVVLQVALGDIKVPLRGKLLKDGGDTIRMRIGDGWDVDIYKAMILTVEEDVMGLLHA